MEITKKELKKVSSHISFFEARTLGHEMLRIHSFPNSQ